MMNANTFQVETHEENNFIYRKFLSNTIVNLDISCREMVLTAITVAGASVAVIIIFHRSTA